jgi:hypothetical protein
MRRVPAWIWLTAASAGGIAAALGLVLFLFWPKEEPPAHPGAVVKTPAALEAHLETALTHLRGGRFRQAADELADVARAWPQAIEALPPGKRRAWNQLHDEAALLADRSAEGVEEILHHATGISADKEWEAQFRKRYLGMAIMFDMEIHKRADGDYHYAYPLAAGKEQARLDLQELRLLGRLDLASSRRVLFGARLASVRLEAPGPVWVVRFQPDSGVLLTDADAAKICCPAWNQAEALKILQEQAGWQRP